MDRERGNVEMIVCATKTTIKQTFRNINGKVGRPFDCRPKSLRPNALNHSESCRIDPRARTTCPCSRRSSQSAWPPAGTCWSASPGCCRTGSRCWSTFRCLFGIWNEREKRKLRLVAVRGYWSAGLCKLTPGRWTQELKMSTSNWVHLNEIHLIDFHWNQFATHNLPSLAAWSLVVVLVARKVGFIEKSGAFSVFTKGERRSELANWFHLLSFRMSN